MRDYSSIGIQIPDLLLPAENIDLQKWSVIACDQFTSQPEYWDQVNKLVSDSPSTLNLILPEVYLGKPEEQAIIESSQQYMHEYLNRKTLTPNEGLVLIERISTSGTRHGLLLALDLEKYDYNKGSTSLIRATEGTIIDRLPPRIRIRENAILELPHIIVLIDDRERKVIEPLWEYSSQLPKIYDFDLMLGSGHLRGLLINNIDIVKRIVKTLEEMATPEHFNQKYNLTKHEPLLLFAVGDGNHSLATAKAVWEKKKNELPANHPLRYALVEIVNIHDEGLVFEPIHRALFGIKQNIIEALQYHFCDDVHICSCISSQEMISEVENSSSHQQIIGLIADGYQGVMTIDHPSVNLPAGTLQEFLDGFLAKGGADGIDYIHGSEPLFGISQKPLNFGFYMPALNKSELFRTVILDGALPCKTFSMGEAKDKRFYLECRKIQDA